MVKIRLGGLSLGLIIGLVLVWIARSLSVISDLSGWPKVTGAEVNSSPAICDLDGDGSLDVIVGSDDNMVYAWDRNGNLLPGWPRETGNNVIPSPAICDLNGDGSLDVVVGSMDRKVYAWDRNGNLLPGWPKETGGEVRSSPAICDLDGDGSLDVIVGSYDYKVYAWDRSGNLLPGWPKETGNEVFSSPTICDLDGDGSLDVIVGSWDGKVYAWDRNGNSLSGWPKVTGGPVLSSPAICDLDGDGFLDVIVGSNDDKVYVWDRNGNLPPGWPKGTGGDVISSPAICDLDGDGFLDVVIGSRDSKVYAWDRNGNLLPGWPKGAGSWVDSSGMFRYDLQHSGTFPHVFEPEDTSPPTVTLLSPNGGEVWKTGSEQTIEWSASDNVGVTSVSLYYSTDGGSTWQEIATGLGNTGTYLWTVPYDPSGNAMVKVIAADAVGNEAEDTSDSVFTIIPASQEILLFRDLNLITPTVSPVSYTSYDLISDLPNCVKVTRWDEGSQYWDSALRDYGSGGIAGTEFNIDVGNGYFVQVDNASSLTLQGNSIESPITLHLVTGLNLIGIPYPSGFYAYDLLQSIPNCVKVVGWNEELQLWEGATRISGDQLLGYNFQIFTDEGYFVQVTSATDWTPSETPLGPGAPKRVIALKRDCMNILSDKRLSRLLDMGVSNLSSASVSISWYTDGMGSGKIIYGEKPDKLDKTVGSDRASAAHMVILRGLKPNTTYYYKVITGDENMKVESPVLNFRTSRIGAGMTYTVYGRLVDYDGTPLSNKGVYLRVRGSRGESSLLSCITDKEGWWWFDLGNLKCDDGGPYLYRRGDEIEIKVMPNGKVILRSKVEGRDVQYLGDVRVPYEMGEVAGRPEGSELLQNYPNPFNPETWIPFKLEKGGEVRMEIYDVKGKLVRKLDLGHLKAGYYIDRSRAAYWDGRNEMGERVASGLYFYVLKAEHFSSTKRMLIVR
jgi:hypothetical protein